MAMTLGEKVAHLKGLSEGLGLDENETHGRLISAIIAVLEEAASTVKSLENRVDELTEQLDSVDEDLDGLEEYVYEELSGEDWDIDDEENEVEVQCPACGETFSVDEEILDEGEMHCPACNELLEFEVSCDCGHNDNEE
ncbi:MAG: hypothetical protein LBT21_07045 [Oscillospiraceae bacterium]|jgi:formylmethanofuran dehydrogenase subunit E|nr:hypothetical protein [Oscillospiraceae bacterium]